CSGLYNIRNNPRLIFEIILYFFVAYFCFFHFYLFSSSNGIAKFLFFGYLDMSRWCFVALFFMYVCPFTYFSKSPTVLTRSSFNSFKSIFVYSSFNSKPSITIFFIKYSPFFIYIFALYQKTIE